VHLSNNDNLLVCFESCITFMSTHQCTDYMSDTGWAGLFRHLNSTLNCVESATLANGLAAGICLTFPQCFSRVPMVPCHSTTGNGPFIAHSARYKYLDNMFDYYTTFLYYCQNFAKKRN
jgi:hypothetical protein